MNVSDWHQTLDNMLEILREAQRHRKEREDWVQGVGPAWILYERNVMFQAVNARRKVLGFAPVTLDAIERVESMASGHSDYTRKFSLYCAELAIGRNEINP